MITPPALSNIGWKYYVILGVFNSCFVPVLAFFFVETKGKTLEDLDMYFAAKYHGGEELRRVEAEVFGRHDLEMKAKKEQIEDTAVTTV